jgi:tripartite ATP-independent transporter DctM subunit
MFLAGFLPGMLAYALYMITVTIMVRKWRPTAEQKKSEGTTFWIALKQFFPVALLFSLVMGGLYGGLFSPTEAAGVGAGLALVFALFRGLSWVEYRAAAIEAVSVSATIFLILIGAEVFGFLLSVSQISYKMVDLIYEYNLSPWMVMLAIIIFYVIMGCFLESLAMILLTVPIFYPVVVASGFDPIWFGIIAVVTVETGLISPPVGMNLFVVQSAAKGLKTKDIMVGVIPFVLADLVRLVILIAFPIISLWLPSIFGTGSL